ncbi:hypothetical protein [Neisseria subflava]|uniref:hypothetical protein n=1 Tax=Neisseria subflava TaxID=28449 RepID=UPI002029F803|nr:hypothetical protein [Neisseria subflava]MCL9764670.1 hypothetical protein [Neisseria subflava]
MRAYRTHPTMRATACFICYVYLEMVMPDLLKIIFEIASFLIQFILAVVGLWYCIETRKLRIESEKQTNNSLMQKKLLITPYLLLGIAVSADDITKRIDVDDEFKKQIKDKIRRDFKISDPADIDEHFHKIITNFSKISIVSIINVTDKIASDISVYIYDNKAKNFTSSTRLPQVLVKEDTRNILIDGNPLSKEEFLEEIKGKYNIKTISEYLSNHTQTKNHNSLILVAFMDIEGNSSMFIRPFERRGNQSFHSPQHLIS